MLVDTASCCLRVLNLSVPPLFGPNPVGRLAREMRLFSVAGMGLPQ